MILFVDDLTVVDFSYFCTQRGPVGESWIADLKLHGDLNDTSMVLDFGLVKKQIKRIIDSSVDHAFVVPSQAPMSIKKSDDATVIDANFGDDNQYHFAMRAPNESVCVIDAEKITIDVVEAYLKDLILGQLDDNIEDLEITLRPQKLDSFYYHYSHGLKKHDGNCQRIVHGHRSTLKIHLDGMNSVKLQKQWAQKWADIYLLTQEDAVPASALEHITADKNDVCSRYFAAQGLFELALSQERVDILPCDTTVECIAQYMADEIKASHPEQQVTVKAYEGVGKGAIGYA